MDQAILNEFIKPELLVLIPVIYMIGVAIKRSELILDKYIPIMLGAVSISLALLYTLTTSGVCCHGIFAAIVQGILVAGSSTYIHQVDKQIRK